MVVAEIQNPVKLSFFPTISISLILLTITTMNHYAGLSKALWIIGTIAHLGFTLYIMQVWIHDPKIETGHVNPAWFIPVVGNILVRDLCRGTLRASIFLSAKSHPNPPSAPKYQCI